MKWLVPTIAAAFVLLAPSVFAQQPAPAAPFDYEAVRLTKITTAVRIAEGIVLDGRLDEPVWQQVEAATDFIQNQPRPGEPTRFRTDVRFLYDDTNLYVGVTCFQPADTPIVLNDLVNDFNFGQSDALNLILDTLHDRRSGFMFMTNPGGARRDGQTSNDGGSGNIDWDGVWDVKVSRFEGGWIAEFEIPFKTLRFTNSPTQEWGFNMTRAVRRANEQSNWAPIPIRFSATRVSLAGTLNGLQNVKQGRNINIKPFFVAGASQLRTGDNLETTRSLGRLKDYDGGVDGKYSLTPSLTLDATYRTDFAQVEADQQQVNLTRFNLFFPEKRDFFLENAGTFAFGPGGNLVPFFSRRIGLSAAGTPIPIVGGGRVTGQVDKYDIGFLAMKTEAFGATPSNNYVVGRVKRSLMRSSWIGALGTSRDASTTGGADFNRVYGADAHFQFYQRLEFDSYLLGSQTPGLEGKQQARRFQTAWKENEYSFSGQYNEVQTNFNPEVGFIRRRDNSQYQGEATFNPQMRQSDLIRTLDFSTSVDYFKSGTTGEIETRVQDASMGLTFETGANANFTIANTFDRLVAPDRIQGIALAAGDYQYLAYSTTAATDSTRRISGNGTVNWGEFWDGRRKSFGGGLSVKPDYHLNVSLTYSRDHLALVNGESTTTLLGTRIVYSFSPRSFFNAFLQYNSTTREVSTNIRFNIMYRPLSDVYVVYNDRRNTAIGEPLERAFVVKVTRLLTF
jgi:uncharacterized protein DUF5916/cellulose/xylan binding protein with CBM9 domain